MKNIVYINGRSRKSKSSERSLTGHLLGLFILNYAFSYGSALADQSPHEQTSHDHASVPSELKDFSEVGANAVCSNWTGIKQMGEAGYSTYGNGVGLDSSGNVYVGGDTHGNLVTGVGDSTGHRDAFTLKYDCEGTWLWTAQLGQVGEHTHGYHLTAHSSGDSFIVGDTTGNLVTGIGTSVGVLDYYLAMRDPAGALQWVAQAGVAGHMSVAQAVGVDSSENSYVIGHTCGNLVTGIGPSTGMFDYFLTQYNSAGSRQWIVQVGIAGTHSIGNGVASDASGTSYITGSTTGNLVAGLGASTGTRDFFVAKYDNAGTRQWISQVGVAGYSAIGNGVSFDASGNSYVVGVTNADLPVGSGASVGRYDGFLAKFDSVGTQQWIIQFGVANQSTSAYAVTVDSTGQINVAGYTTGDLVGGVGPATGRIDYFVAQFDSTGTQQWIYQDGIAGTISIPMAITVDSTDNIFVAGFTSGDLTSGSGPATGLRDSFVAKFNSSGTLQ